VREYIYMEETSLRSDWESLAPEILALVLQRVQANWSCGSDQHRGDHEGRRIVAVAGVCRSWRRLVLQQEEASAAAAAVLQQSGSSMCSTSSSSSPLIRFPAAIRRRHVEPAAAADCSCRPLQCVLKKEGNSFSFFQTFQSLDQHGVNDGVVEEYFLLGARKRYMPSCSSFELSTDTRILQAKDRAAAASGKYSAVLASVIRSNFSRSAFVIGDRGEAPGDLEESSSSSSPLCVKYSEERMAGMRRRKLSCSSLQAATSRSTPTASSSPKTSRAARAAAPVTTRRASVATAPAPARTSGFFAAWSCALFNTRRQVRRVHMSTLEDEQEQSSRGQSGDGVLQQISKQLVVQEDQEGAEPEATASPRSSGLSLKSKTPEWNQEHGCWSLDFKGRATMASIHNFQLVLDSSTRGSTVDHAAAATQLDHPSEKVVLQLGKVAKGVYQVDFCSPVSALQAFCICLTSFATNVGLEP
jgi:hypothetical protein